MIAFILLCGVFTAYSRHIYKDDFARNKMMPLSAAAYSSDPKLCVKTIDPTAEEVEQVTRKCDGQNTCSGYAAVLPKEKAIVIGFRWKADVGSVASYFCNAFNEVWENGLKDIVSKLIKENKDKDYYIWITGHSLGGAMASLAASYIVEHNMAKGDKIKLVTFGQPETGDTKFVDLLKKQVEYSYRVVHYHDPVVEFPILRYTYQDTEVLNKYGKVPTTSSNFPPSYF
ncbi:unnamed protein product [Strongylus vulgaris]|uniref:Fungal lipase-type domain-containing protein n=1 Tax=Strongylus vulgaris TaxID=40348 RepID=A0A3P7L6B9_STRVU|nr:unnamed protein product [Strongylus vulgaris]